MVYLVIANPHAIATHTETGVVVSRHRSIDAARKALDLPRNRGAFRSIIVEGKIHRPVGAGATGTSISRYAD
jgi:hypothetical protein